MKEIQLTKGFITLVDDEDHEIFSSYNWFISGKGYAVRNTPRPHTNGRWIYLHREILSAPVGLFVDHINMDKLDNRRCNLRLVNKSQNSANSLPKITNILGVKGVSIDWRSMKFQSQIIVNSKAIYLGYFDNLWDAAMAYNNAAIIYFQDYARPNKLLDSYKTTTPNIVQKKRNSGFGEGL